MPVQTLIADDDPDEAKRAIERIRREDNAQGFPMITDAQVNQAEKSVENVNKIKRIALRVTNENDWTHFDGKPYLNESGCMKVATLFGVSFRDAKVTQVRETIEGREIIRYVCRMAAEFGGRVVEVEGLASSSDQFFTHHGKLPLGEVNLDNVRKKAVTNAQSRGLKKILGLGALTQDDVRAGLGAKTEQVQGVNFAASKAKKQDREAPEGDPKQQVENMIGDLARWSDCDPLELLKGFTTFKGQKDGKDVWCRGFDKLSDKWAAGIVKKVREAWQAHPGAGAAEAPGADQPPMPSEEEIPF